MDIDGWHFSCIDALHWSVYVQTHNHKNKCKTFVMWQAITNSHMVEKRIDNYTSFWSNTIFIWTTIPLIEMFVFTFNTFDMNENKQWYF